jgi:hypothetical protein
MIMIIQQFVERIDVQQVVGLDHNTLYGEVLGFFLLCPKVNASADPRGRDRDVALMGRGQRRRACGQRRENVKLIVIKMLLI